MILLIKILHNIIDKSHLMIEMKIIYNYLQNLNDNQFVKYDKEVKFILMNKMKFRKIILKMKYFHNKLIIMINHSKMIDLSHSIKQHNSFNQIVVLHQSKNEAVQDQISQSRHKLNVFKINYIKNRNNSMLF